MKPIKKSIAPLKFTAGMEMIKPELGSRDFDGKNLYITINDKGVPTRKKYG